MDKELFKLIVGLMFTGVFIFAVINHSDHIDMSKTHQYQVIDKRETVGSHFSIFNKGVRTDYNIVFKRTDNSSIFSCKDVEYEVYIRYQLNGKYAITEEEMQRLSRIYDSDCYK